MKLTFLGGAQTVTGSKYLLEDAGKRHLVDCGLFQGLKDLRLRNWESFPVPPSSISSILLTHAHIDHSGYIPRLVKDGFNGPIYCSPATLDLCSIVLPDSGHLQEEDAERANRYGYSKHHPALPLYTEQDARDCLGNFRPVEYGKRSKFGEFLCFSLHRAGHILGSSMIKIDDGATSIVFSGDIGRDNDPVMKPPVQMEAADYVVTESTYGDRLHAASDPFQDLTEVITRTIRRGGTIVIPAFAVGRAQLLLYYLFMLKREGRIPAHLPVFLDSPMAINASDLLLKYHNELRLPAGTCRAICEIAKYTRTREESRALDGIATGLPAVIISASGMATGGRVLHHMKRFIGDARNTILFAGFQAAGTRGARLLAGEEEIKIHGQMHSVRAEIVKLDNISAHADYRGILGWLGNFTSSPRKTFITHGEPSASQSLKEKIIKDLGWDAVVPEMGQSVEL
ncbi:MAG: MBL fold metallo-hydrolase RNA specificity domain-containing protein [Alphaproteobacteria bacterium]